jgi:hypothetical protein
MDEDGGLRTTRTLDFEQISSYSLSVHAFDPYGGILEKNFIIEVVDAFLPIVDTFSVQAQITPFSPISLQGQIVDYGGSSEISEVGFLISRSPIRDENDPGLLRLTATLEQNGSFTAEFIPLFRGSKHYVAAFALNGEGINYGLEDTFVSLGLIEPDSWSVAVENATTPGWWSSPWFGNFYRSKETGWILHDQLGWLFPSPLGLSGIWFWQQDLGWLWTSMDAFPFFYRNSPKGWTFFYGSHEQNGLFYDYSLQNWIVLAQEPPLEFENESGL